MDEKKYGITDTGFRPKTFTEIKKEYQELLAEVSDPKTGEHLDLDFNSDDIFVQILNIVMEREAEQWQMLANVYSQFNPNMATKESLSSLAQINGIIRYKGQPSTVKLKYTNGSAVDILVKSGNRVTDENETVIWKLNDDLIVPANSSAIGVATSMQNGIFELETGTINQMLDAVTGIQSVINDEPSEGGEIDETDLELRRRRKQTIMVASRNAAESLYSGVVSVPGVQYCKVYDNKALETDERNIPAKTVCIVVQGGSQTEIASEIMNRLGAGINTYGNIETKFIDSLGVEDIIRFQRPITVHIRVSVNVSKIDDNTFPENYATQIKENIMQYALRGSSALGINTQEGFDDYGFGVNKDVVLSKLYTPINAVPGLKINSVYIAKEDDEFGVDDIGIAWNEVSEFSTDNIEVILS